MLLLTPLRNFAVALTNNFAQHTIAANPEDQLKAPVQDLLREAGTTFKINVVPRTEAQLSDLNARPDIGVTTGGLLCGYIELKAPGLGANPSKLKGEQNKRQWQKFQTLPNLIYTDGNEWALFRTGEQIGKTVRLSGDITKEGTRAVDDDDAQNLEALLRDFLTWEPIVPHTPRELAHYLAPLTRLIRDEAHAAVERPDSAIRLLVDEWRAYLFPEADDHRFADAYAQTLTYALLLARLSGAGDLTPDEAAKALDKGNGLLAQTLRILAQPQARDEIALGFGPLKRALEALDPHDLMRRSPDVWLYFYEDFLAAYDPKLRKDSGVYYTPVQVVRCQVRLIAELLRTRFGKKLSFADDGVTFLDPAVGTGTYPIAAIDHALALVEEHSGKGAVPGRASQLARNFFGFEFLVGPYAVAHLRLTQKITADDVGGTLPDGRLQVYLADTLDSPNARPEGLVTLMGKRLVEERMHARRVKAEQHVLVCLGNPPYDRQQIDPDDSETQRKGGWVRFGDKETPRPIFEDFLEPARKAGSGVHLKNLYNDYVYFWRWALWKIFERQQGGAILSFITASSYLAGPGFIGMREVMRRTFDDLWIINLEGDNRGPRKSENVFAIQTPVAITIGTRHGEGNPNAPAKVRYVRIEGSRETKLTWLDGIEQIDQIDWQDGPGDWHAPFLPIGHGDYFAWPALTEVFPWQTSGAQFKRTWPIGPTQDTLERRWKHLLSTKPDARAKLFVETRDRKVKGIYDNGLPGSNEASLYRLSENAAPVIRTYAYRSFIRTFVIYDTRLGDYLRPELFHSYSNRQLHLTAFLSAPVGEGPAATVTHLLPDLDHFRGSFGAKHVIPLWRDAASTEANVASGVIHRLNSALSMSIDPGDLFAYVYAVLANPGYVRRFWEELATPGPRLPITKDAALFRRGVDLGRRFVWLHTYGERMAPGGEHDRIPQGSARCLAPVPDAPDRYPEDFAYDPIQREVRVGEGRFGPVAPEIFEFSVSGFEVVKSWLGYRMKERAGRRSSPLDDIGPERWTARMTDEFLELLWVLEHTLALYPQLDDLLDAVVAGPCFTADELPRPSEAERKGPQRRADERQSTLV